MKAEHTTKVCPFCAEEIKVDATKCRYCSEMLGPAPNQTGNSRKVRYETQIFVIPFPDGSPPTQYLLKSGNRPFPGEFQRAMAWSNHWRSWIAGVTELWDWYKDYFLDRINELGQEGWELAEPFEQPRDEFGWLARYNDRFATEDLEVPGMFFGKVSRFRLMGARFMMRRVNLE